MKPIFTRLAILTALAVSPAFSASVVTSLATFDSQITGPSYTENFSSLASSGLGASSLAFTDGTFGYTVSVNAGNLWGLNGSDRALGTDTAGTTIFTITFTSNNVTAVGGNFFYSDAADAFISAQISLVLNDGTTAIYTPADRTAFRGFLSPGVPITSISFAAATGAFPNVDNLKVGTAASVSTEIPEPGTMALVGLGALVVFARRIRR